MANCGQWHLEREIGHGAYGVVFLAEGPDGERAAVKVCRRDAIGEERYERELRGAKLYRTIPSQEGLVRMREFVEESWGFYAVLAPFAGLVVGLAAVERLFDFETCAGAGGFAANFAVMVFFSQWRFISLQEDSCAARTRGALRVV